MTDNHSLYKSSPCPATSPWGAIQDKRELAPGIWSVSTAGHGCIKLSRERNAAMPDYMRNKGGWYEEDCEWAKVAVFFPAGFQRTFKDRHGVDQTEYDCALETFRNWFPEEYESFFNVALSPGQSHCRDQRIFELNTRDKFVVSAAWGSWAAWVPDGKVGVLAVTRNDNQMRKWFLVDEGLYDQRGPFGFVIDQTRDHEIPEPENKIRLSR